MPPEAVSDDPATGSSPLGGKGGTDDLAAAILKARSELAGVIDRLVKASVAPDRQTQGLVAACNAIIALAVREPGQAAASGQAGVVVVVAQDAARAELEARGKGSRVLHAVRGGNAG